MGCVLCRWSHPPFRGSCTPVASIHTAPRRSHSELAPPSRGSVDDRCGCEHGGRARRDSFLVFRRSLPRALLGRERCDCTVPSDTWMPASRRIPARHGAAPGGCVGGLLLGGEQADEQQQHEEQHGHGDHEHAPEAHQALPHQCHLADVCSGSADRRLPQREPFPYRTGRRWLSWAATPPASRGADHARARDTPRHDGHDVCVHAFLHVSQQECSRRRTSSAATARVPFVFMPSLGPAATGSALGFRRGSWCHRPPPRRPATPRSR